jgi:predicted enzyme related to lactoylglutathione lyase
MTSDTGAAEAFYGHVVGWNARDASQPGAPYTLMLAGETEVAGVMPIHEAMRTAGARPVWRGYVEVEDVDAAADHVTALGGSVYRPPSDIPGVGRFAVVADPQGAVFLLFKGTAAMTLPPAVPDKPGYVAWRELMAADGAAAFAFYAELFGWTKAEAMDMGPMGIYQLYACHGDTIGGMMTKPPGVPAPFWIYYFQVDGIEAAIARLKSGGGTVTNGPHQVPGGQWIVQGLDPQGGVFALVSWNA